MDPATQKAQGERCACRGTDDMCVCQNQVMPPRFVRDEKGYLPKEAWKASGLAVEEPVLSGYAHVPEAYYTRIADEPRDLNAEFQMASAQCETSRARITISRMGNGGDEPDTFAIKRERKRSQQVQMTQDDLRVLYHLIKASGLVEAPEPFRLLTREEVLERRRREAL